MTARCPLCGYATIYMRTQNKKRKHKGILLKKYRCSTCGWEGDSLEELKCPNRVNYTKAPQLE